MLDARSDPDVTPDALARDRGHRTSCASSQRQKDLGFEIFTDGELRRGGFMSDFYESVDGLDEDGSIARAWKGSRQPAAPTVPLPAAAGVVVGKITADQAADQSTRSTS